MGQVVGRAVAVVKPAWIKPAAIKPEPATFGILHPVVITGIRIEDGVAARRIRGAPPFRGDPLGAFGAGNSVLPAAPAKRYRRVIGHWRDRFDKFGPGQQPGRAWLRRFPDICWARRWCPAGQSRCAGLYPFGQMAIASGKPAHVFRTEPARQPVNQAFQGGGVAVPGAGQPGL